MQNMVADLCKYLCARLAIPRFSGAYLGLPRGQSLAMGATQNELQWGTLLWRHLCIEVMFFFCKRNAILCKHALF